MKRLPISFLCSPFVLLPCALALSIILPSCTGENRKYTGTNRTGHGPFNERGDYVEDWADSPSKWKSGLFGSKTPPPVPQDEQALIAGNDNPPANLSPLGSAQGTSKTSPPREVEVARREPTRTVSSTTPKPRTTVSSSTPKPKPKTSVASTKPKPKPKVAVKPKTSPSTRVTVKKGDTLYDLAIRHKSSVSAIQKANGISGTNLTIGKSLSIPRK